VAEAKLITDTRSLGALARSRGPNKDNVLSGLGRTDLSSVDLCEQVLKLETSEGSHLLISLLINIMVINN
jgi:hypothetical protein